MQFVSDFFVGILTVYISLTNSLAMLISPGDFPEPQNNVPMVTEVDESKGFFSSLPSTIGGVIPDVLLKSAEYQSAALSNATGLTQGNTKNPIDALVNIFCTYTTEDYIRTTTGTGFFVDTDGVIMTNAHIAQFLLLEQTEEFGVTECVVRTGNPASPRYLAELLYIPPAWVQANAGVLYQELPMGTGERDYALLYASRSINNQPLPAEFPALELDDSLLPTSMKNNTVTAAGYPAQDLILNGPDTDLIPREADTSISELYTFGSNYADVFSIRGSAVGAQGASGGPVLNADGEVIGVIVTRGDDTIDGSGSLRAITLSHISRTIEEESGLTFEASLNGNLSYRAQVFREILSPFLLTLLQNERPVSE
jgi:S1-C subfamily serine protease